MTLIADAITKEYATRQTSLSVLSGASLTLEPGDRTVIMGPSGSGKSTFLNIVGTLETPTAGKLTIDGRSPFDLDPARLAQFRNQEIGFVFQDHHLLPQCSVLENVLVPTLVESSDQSSEARARQLLDRVGLSDRMDHRPAELSGGERQRVAVARAMINRPQLVLADEPTGNLDRKTADAVSELLLELYREESAILIAVTHSQILADRFDRRYELADGRLVQAG